jgi:predicted phage terminase large subunit-like protein
MALWSRQHEQLRVRALEVIGRYATPFSENSPAEQAARRRLPMLDWCRTYLPHYFDAPFAAFHRDMSDAVGTPGLPTFVCAFRGAGKSALLALARPLRRTLSAETPYCVYGSQVQKLAAQNMDYVRLELEYNPRIHGDYGEPEVTGAQAEWIVRLAQGQGSAKFEAFGIGMSPRGRRYGEYRPVEFVGDDLEDAELARNPERERNLWDWLMDEVVPALEPDSFTFTVLGTMFGPDCMIERARRLSDRRDAAGRPLGRTFVQKVTDGGRSVWPERFGDDTLSRIRATIGLRNWLRNFALEPDDPDKPFQAQWFGTYRPEEIDTDRLDVVAFLDPAVSQGATGCPRALVAVGADRATGVRHVLDAWIERGSPAEMAERLFRFNRRLRPRIIGIEQNGGYALLKPLLDMLGAQRGERLPVRYVTHTRPKALRIEVLCSQFEAGRWRFPAVPNAGVKILQEQFLSYPDGFVDGPDAAAGCDELLPAAFATVRADEAYRTLTKRRDVHDL